MLEVGGGVAFVIHPSNREIVFRVCVLRDVSCVRSCAWFCGAKTVLLKKSDSSSSSCSSGGRVRGGVARMSRGVARCRAVLRGVARCRAVSRGVARCRVVSRFVALCQ